MNPNEDLSKKFRRHTARKLWIGTIVQADIVQDAEGRAFSLGDLRFVRVNIMGIVLHSFVNEKKDYGFLVLDDGSGQLTCKFWHEDAKWVEHASVGDVILVVGKVFVSEQEIAVGGEFLRKLNVDWFLLRKKELLASLGRIEKAEWKALPVVEEKVNQPSLRVRVLEALERAPPEGLKIQKLAGSFGRNAGDVEGLLQGLISEGEVFSPRVGFVKLLS